jgi:rubrerythrin
MNHNVPEYRTLVEVLEDAILKESDAEQFYLDSMELAQTDEVKQFLLRMAAMEREHFDLLTGRLETLKAEQHSIDGIQSSYEKSS